MRRTGLRNALVAAGNSGDPTLLRSNRTGVGADFDAGARGFQGFEVGLFVDADAELQRSGAQAPGRTRRIQHGARMTPDPRLIGRRVDFRPHCVAVEPLRRASERLKFLQILSEVFDLMGLCRHRQRPGRLETRIDLVPLECCQIALEVFFRKLLDGLDLTREVVEAVEQSMGQRSIGEATVASRGPFRHGIALQQHDVAIRIVFLRLYGRP